MDDFEFYLEGENTDSTASAFEAFFKEAFDQQIHLDVRQPQKTDQREKADPIAVAALVLAVPGAVLAAPNPR